MFLLGALVFWKLNLLASELAHLVSLTHASIENLKSVQTRITQSQKLAALGRLAAGATHEISNPLTAILGYSELLGDIPSLSASDRENAQIIQQQVHKAQAAVNSLRSSPERPSSTAPHHHSKSGRNRNLTSRRSLGTGFLREKPFQGLPNFAFPGIASFFPYNPAPSVKMQNWGNDFLKGTSILTSPQARTNLRRAPNKELQIEWQQHQKR